MVAEPGIRVLVADDNPINQELAQRILEKKGYAVTVVGDGQAAVQAVQSTPFAIVLMDCLMPVMDGFAATEAIRAEEAGEGRIPIVGVTASGRREDQDRCAAVGMDGFLAKPYRPDDLVAIVERWTATGSADGGEPPAVDPQSLALLAEDDLLEELSRMFVTEGGARVADLRAAAEVDDVDTVRTVVHRLRGSAGIFGAHKLVELCRRTEEATPTGPALRDGIEAIAAEFQRAVDALGGG